MTVLYCPDGHERKTERMQPQPHELSCPECGRGMSTFRKQRSELRRVSDKRMEAEGEKLAARGSTLRSRRRKKLSIAEFHRLVTDDGTSGCALAYDGGCWGGVQAHHYVPQQRIKRAGLPAKDLACALNDPRNGVPLCHFHHGQVEAARLCSPRPLDLEEFLEEFGLTEAGRLAAA